MCTKSQFRVFTECAVFGIQELSQRRLVSLLLYLIWSVLLDNMTVFLQYLWLYSPCKRNVIRSIFVNLKH